MKTFFPDEGKVEIGPEFYIAKSVLDLELKLLDFNLSSVNRARIMVRIKELNAQLDVIYKENQDTSTKKIIALWEDFDDLCLSLSKLDGQMSFTEIQALSVYYFYRLKKFLFKLHKPKNALTNDE